MGISYRYVCQIVVSISQVGVYASGTEPSPNISLLVGSLACELCWLVSCGIMRIHRIYSYKYLGKLE